MKNCKFLLLLFTLLIFQGCQKSQMDDLIVKDQNNYLVTKLKITEVPDKDNLLDLVNDIKKDLTTKLNPSLQKSNSITINANDAIYVESIIENFHSYTFSISSSDSNIYNLVLKSNDSINYSAFLLSYDLSIEERQLFESGELAFEIEDRVTIESIDSEHINLQKTAGGSCFDLVLVEEYSDCPAGHDAFACTTSCCGGCFGQVHEWQEVPCPGSGGGSETNGTSEANSGSQTNGNENNGPNTGGPVGGNEIPNNKIPTAPNFSDGSNASASFLIGQLGLDELNIADQVMIDWINNPNNIDIVNIFRNFIANNNTDNSQLFALELLNVIMLDQTIDLDALNFVIIAYNQDKIYNNFDVNFYLATNQYTALDLSDPIHQTPFLLNYLIKVAKLRQLNPEWSETKVYWEATKDVIHIALDIFGMVPVVGEVADIINGALYAIDGDGVNASLSLASAIPFVGWGSTATKYAIKITNTVTEQTTKLIWKVTANGIEFGRRGQLAIVLGTAGTGLHAHHIIPWELRNLEIVQKAARSNFSFHPNDLMNGIPLPSTNHLTGHNSIGGYNDTVRDILQDFHDNFPNASNNDAFNFLNGLTTHIRGLINANPNMNMGQIADLIDFPN